jgi:thioredoxin 1
MRDYCAKRVRDLFWAAVFAAAAAAVFCVAPRVAKCQEASLVLLEFCADWCGACRQMEPVVEQLRGEGYRVESVDVDRCPELARQYHVTSIPCFVAIEGGREVDRIVGQASIERLTLRLRAKTTASNSSVSSAEPVALSVPRPAWRYERAVGYRAAVVRIFCQDDGSSHSIGSGTLVNWKGKIVVLTARHVVKDAKAIVVELCTKKRHRAKLLAADPVWDCAALELADEPVGVEPADVERGEVAMLSAGRRLESCGYGADGRLACNSGLFLTYKRSSEKPEGPDDWFTISGHARNGDSGGGVFNVQGRLVGVLWGTDGQEVACVQAGRLHELLDAAIVRMDATEMKSILSRAPTPARPADSPCTGGCCPAVEANVSAAQRPPALPWRKETKNHDDAQDARIEALIRLQEQRARAAGIAKQPKAEPSKTELGTHAEQKDDASPIVAAMVILGSLAIGGVFYSLTKKKA